MNTTNPTDQIGAGLRGDDAFEIRLQAAAEAGHEQAKDFLRRRAEHEAQGEWIRALECLRDGIRENFENGGTKKLEEAVGRFRAFAERGNAEAQYYLGCHYLDGSGVAEDRAEAEKWLRLAAAGGNAPAKAVLEKFFDPTPAIASG